MTSGSFGSGYQDLDAAADPEALLTYLDGMATAPMIGAAKQRATDALGLGPGKRVLEVGCGTGVDLPGLADAVGPDGRVIGVDLSELAVEQAARRMDAARWVSVQVADAHRLPFADGAFHALRVDRTMLHLADPEGALREFRRVLVPGGRLAILELGSTLEGDHPLVGSDVHRALLGRYWAANEQVAQINLFLPLLLARTGYGDVRFERASGTAAEFDIADRLLRLRAAARELDTVAHGEAERWLRELDAAMTAGHVVVAWATALFVATATD